MSRIPNSTEMVTIFRKRISRLCRQVDSKWGHLLLAFGVAVIGALLEALPKDRVTLNLRKDSSSDAHVSWSLIVMNQSKLPSTIQIEPSCDCIDVHQSEAISILPRAFRVVKGGIHLPVPANTRPVLEIKVHDDNGAYYVLQDLTSVYEK